MIVSLASVALLLAMNSLLSVGRPCDQPDCNNRGTAVTGIPPNCVCTCMGGYTGPTCASCLPQYTGTSCQTRICHVDYDCHGHGSSMNVNTFYQYPNCFCYCSGGWASPSCSSCAANYIGSNCNTRVCYVGSDCSGQGQSISGSYPDCQCTCNVPYTGASCQQQYCHKDYHCNGHATAISGTYYPSCTCSCTPQYIGSYCQTRICHINYDCNEVGLSINGTYPNCKCLCPRGYAGRSCRTESQTLSLSPSKSLTLTTTRTNTVSSSVSSSPSKSDSNTISSSQSTSLSLTGSSTFTRSATLSVSRETESQPLSLSPSRSLTLTATCLPEYQGPNCKTRVCYVGSDCNGQGQSISGSYPDCQCTCNVPYTGASCQQQYCHKDYHCNGHATAISGTYYPSCTCSCTPQYIGNACETRICHAYYDCNEVGLSVYGVYPNCKCLCPRGYAGRSCNESQTLSLSPSRSLTLTPTNTVSTSVSSSPSKSTRSATNSLANYSIGVICQLVKVASDQSALFDTCTEPGPTETAAKDSTYVPLAKYIGNAAKQDAIQSSYDGPALPSGNLFSYGSVRVLWPEGMAEVNHVAAASPSIAACWVHAGSANATEILVAVAALTVAADTALDFHSAPVFLMYLSLNVRCGAATTVQCTVFNRTIAMERPVVYLPKKAFVPDKAVQATATTTGALTVTVGAAAVPIAAMQQGVALALMRMAQCEDALNGEPLDVSVHPLQFGLGGGAGRYGRGALVGNLLVVPAIWCTIMYLLAPFAIRALTRRTLDASRDFVGWPGMALMPLAVLSEGSTMASVGLMTQGNVGDIIMGLIGLAILLVTTACWAAELRRMRCHVVLRRASGVESWAKAIHPRFEWEVGKKKREGNTLDVASYLDKRIQLVGSSWWLWSALAAHVLSMVVGVSESLPASSGMCRVRWAVASLAAVLQAAVVMTNTVPVELLLLGVIGAMSCILVVLIALSTFDVGSSGSTFSALNAAGMVNSILGIALLGIGACTGAYEIFTQRSRRALSAQIYTEGPATPLSLLVPMVPQQQASPPSEELEELSIEAPQNLRSSRYPDMPAQWASILDDADLAISERELASVRLKL